MEFWGAEVKIGESLAIHPGDGMILHLSQACLGEVKKEKGNDSVCLFVNVDGKKLVLGTLFSEKLPQQQFDLVFDKYFELSHNWKKGSVYFCGYKAVNPVDDSDDEDDTEPGFQDGLPVTAASNEKPATQAKQEKPSRAEKAHAVKETAVGKQKVKLVEPNKSDGSNESYDVMSENESDSEEDEEGDSDSSEGEEDSDDESEETHKKIEPLKKRAAESTAKTAGPDKKAKPITPQKSDGKKGGGHVATPHPTKLARKTPANKLNQRTSKSGGSYACKSCPRSFNTEQARDSHTKAKHSAGE